MLDYLRSEDEGVDVVTEEFSSSRGSSETQGPLGERGKCSMELPCSQPQCRAADKLDNIMKAGLAHSIVLLQISLRLEVRDTHDGRHDGGDFVPCFQAWKESSRYYTLDVT